MCALLSLQSYTILSKLHPKTLTKIKQSKKKENLTIQNYLIFSHLQKSYRIGLKKNKKNDTAY